MNFIKKNLLRLGSYLCYNHASKIVFYHDIFSERRYTDMGTSFARFEEHLATIAQTQFEIVTRIIEKKHQVQICFDDGFQGLWDCRQLFTKFSWRPTVFIAVELIGQKKYLSLEQIKELQNQGVVFQGHSWSHQILTQFHGAALRHEVIDSKHKLSELLGREVTEICFPVGNFSDEVLACCREAGYRQMYASIPGNYDDPVFPGVVKRNLLQFYTPQEVRWVLLGGLAPFARRYYKMHYQKEK